MNSNEILRQDMTTWELPGMELHHFMDELREQAPIVPISFLDTPSWLITRYDTLEQGFKDTEGLPPHRAYQFGIAPLIGENFQSMEGERHRFYRKLATPTFRPKMVEKIDNTLLEDVANELIDRFVTRETADIVEVFTEHYPYIVIARLLGIPRDEEAQFSRWVVGLLNFNSEPKRAYQCRDELWEYLDPVIEDRRHNPRDDVISQLIHDEIDGVRMDDALLKSHIGIMFSAGSSTTHDSIGNLLYGLLSTKNYWEQVRDYPELRDNAIEEALRWEAAVSFLPRMTREDQVTHIAGAEIPADTFVFMGIAAANHDPALCSNPHEYDIHRQECKMMTFGHGPRTCPGMHLARKELRVTLDVLLERLPNLELIDADAAAPSGTIFRNPNKLVCKL
jgi:cytochrome P450